MHQRTSSMSFGTVYPGRGVLTSARGRRSQARRAVARSNTQLQPCSYGLAFSLSGVLMRKILFGFVTFLATAYCVAFAAGQPGKPEFKFGWIDCSAPVLVLQPRAGISTKLSAITYDAGGYVVSFRQVFEYPGTAPIVVEVTTDPFSGCPSRTARASGSAVNPGTTRFGEFKSTGLRGLIGFAPKELGGVVVMDGTKGPVTSQFAYDGGGQRRLSQQEFSIGGSTYIVDYSNVVLDRGRITAYDAVIGVKK